MADGGGAPSLEQFHDWVDQLQFTTGTNNHPNQFRGSLLSLGMALWHTTGCNQGTNTQAGRVALLMATAMV